MFVTVDPATGDLLREHRVHSSVEVEEILERSVRAEKLWNETTLEQRCELTMVLHDVLLERQTEYARLIVQEMGKPIRQANDELAKCRWLCSYVADSARSALSPQPVAATGRSYIAYEPLGTVLAIMPWNFPFWQALRAFLPTAVAGNCVILKHAENTQGCAEAIVGLVHDCGFPEGVLQNLRLPRADVAEVVRDHRIRAATLTGSVEAGRSVAGVAGSVGKPTVLELGGSDPYVVLQDADIVHAARTGVAARLLNAGQVCVAPKRFIVEESVYGDFMEALMGACDDVVVGEPNRDETDMGPMARGDLRQALHDQVKRAVAGGASLVRGGEIPDTAGFYYPVTILTDVHADNIAATEELFGPVVAVMTAKTEDHAIELANQTPFGLGAALWTGDLSRAEVLARRLEAGMVTINDSVKSDPRLPFGGTKASGYGRELGAAGFLQFTNCKTVSIAS